MDVEVIESRDEIHLDPENEVSVEEADIELESVGSLLDDDMEQPIAATVSEQGQHKDSVEETIEDGESELEYESDEVELEDEGNEDVLEETEEQAKDEVEDYTEEKDEVVGLTDEESQEHDELEQLDQTNNATKEEGEEGEEADEEEEVGEGDDLLEETNEENTNVPDSLPIYIDLGTEVFKLVQPAVPEEADFQELSVLFDEDIFDLSLSLFFSRVREKQKFRNDQELILKCCSLGDLAIEEDAVHCGKLKLDDLIKLFIGLRTNSDNPDLYKYIQFEVLTRSRFISRYERLQSQLVSGKGLESVEWEETPDNLPLQSDFLIILGLLNNSILLGQDELDVGWRRLVSVDSTVCSESSSSLFWSLVDLDVGDDKFRSVKTLGLSVGFSVHKQTLDEFDTLGWPSGLGDTKLFSLSSSTNRSVESSEWNGSLVVQNLVQVLFGFLEFPSLDSLGGFSGVLEGHSQV
ncbi:hypothetical protein OGAPHI_003951 [Ogataea philodendri]|uniref:Uncharacterized protein n=1 Tax=Ogataea philodendri TaxID=1378263 RepID=A0A9P8T4B4_9ASCO|nr:uncharacterized protein OGAPHI_003951 [Ogataea philodendri]KAH3665763.1 hypothetical protein OGAPHI_003951 [Ogataea philodendri]